MNSPVSGFCYIFRGWIQSQTADFRARKSAERTSFFRVTCRSATRHAPQHTRRYNLPDYLVLYGNFTGVSYRGSLHTDTPHTSWKSFPLRTHWRVKAHFALTCPWVQLCSVLTTHCCTLWLQVTGKTSCGARFGSLEGSASRVWMGCVLLLLCHFLWEHFESWWFPMMDGSLILGQCMNSVFICCVSAGQHSLTQDTHMSVNMDAIANNEGKQICGGFFIQNPYFHWFW